MTTPQRPEGQKPKRDTTPLRVALVILPFVVIAIALGTLLNTALGLVAKGGEIFVFGVNHAAEITIRPAVIVDKEASIRGIYIAKGTFPLALRLLSAHPELFGKIVSHRVPLEDWDHARDLLMSGQAPGKILVTMAGS